MRLVGKAALVTGAGRGLGKAIALALAREGADVAINDIELSVAQKVSAEVQAVKRKSLAIKADTADKTEVENMVKQVVKEFGKIDILVNNAGIFIIGASEDLEESRWRRGLDVDLTGVFFCSQAAGKEMIKRKQGKIISLASIAGIGAMPERACYCSAKAGVIQLTKVLGCEWAKYNINVNAVAPGYIRTEAFTDFVQSGVLDEKALAGRIPAGAVGRPEDIANAVVFLASDESRYITGQTLVVDGGWSAYSFLQSWLDESHQ